MFQAFERHLATSLNQRLAAPWRDRIHAAIDPSPPGNGGHIRCALSGFQARPNDLGQRMPPLSRKLNDGDQTQLRGLYLDARVLIQVIAGGQIDLLAGLEQLLYLLDDAEFRQGRVLDGRDPNRGFLIEYLAMSDTQLSESGDRADIQLLARGWFWPVDQPGDSGELIRQIPIQAHITGAT